MYNDAVVLGAEVGGQQRQEDEHKNVPLEEVINDNVYVGDQDDIDVIIGH